MLRLPFLFAMLKISYLPHNSIAYKSGLRKDDVIVAFNGNKAEDMLDVAYYDSQDKFDVTVLRKDKQLTLSVDKAAEYPMEWDFYEQCYITPKWCANKCIFCFVDQLPANQRETLYVKDDDWRLSFVSGNFVTLTNVSDREIQRICDKKFSPLYISVHATDDDVRRKLLGNMRARDIMPLLKQFAASGITMHTQVVMVADYNDGDVLQKTMEDLYSLYPAVASLAVVPVGLTKYRKNLADIQPVSQQVAYKTVKQVEQFDKKVFDKHGNHFVYCSDEMYIYAELPIPDYSYYDDFEQLENGVGLVADLRYQFELAFADAKSAKNKSFTLITGVSATPFLQELLDKAKNKFEGLQANIVTVVNKFFGETVTVAGLVVGQDIVSTVEQCKDSVGDVVLLPRVMLRETEDVFLDGMTLQQLQEKLGKPIEIVADGYELCRALLECD